MPGDVNATDEAFDRWYRTHHARIFTQCRRTLRDDAAAEDVAHETLLRAWLGRDRMREEDLGAWLSVVARNLCISHIRKQRRMVPTEKLPDVVDPGLDPAVQAERAESRRALRRAMSQIGDRHRVLFFRREIEGAEYEELGEEIGLTAEGARTIAFRTRRVLRRHLEAVGESFAGVVLGIRIRVRAATARVRTAAGSVEVNLSSFAQTGINAVLAVTIAFGSGGAGVVGGALVAQPAAVAIRVGTPAGHSGGGDPTSLASGAAALSSPAGAAGRASRGLVGRVFPRTGGYAWDTHDHSQDTWVKVFGVKLVEITGGAGRDKDVGDPVYPFVDQGVYTSCKASKTVCDLIIGH
jgi:RNA polymerase sigma-70 factor (ECF subfamily)